MKISDLDLLKTKKDFLRPENLNKFELEEMANTTQEERFAYSTIPPISLQTLQSLEKITASSTIYIAKTVEHPYLTKKMHQLLLLLESEIKKQIDNPIIIIVSMTRTADESKETNNIIATTSTHTKGEAIDIAGKFMKKYFPQSAHALEKIINRLTEKNKIYFSNEENTTSFWHIARKSI